MRYYAAKQRQSDGRFDFTVTHGSYTYPAGYCAPYRPWTENGKLFIPVPAETLRKFEENSHKHHDTGHATAQEAAECYFLYLLDQRLRLGLEQEGRQEKCKECGAWTSLYAELDCFKFIVLCEAHNSREVVERHVRPSTEIWES